MELNRKTIQKLLGIIAFAVLLYWGLQNLDRLGRLAGILLGLFAPFLVGGCIAFILNVPMRFFEKTFFPVRSSESAARRILRRPLSLFISIVFVFGVVAVVLFSIGPGIKDSVQKLNSTMPAFWADFSIWLGEISQALPELGGWLQQALTQVQFDWNSIFSSVFGFLQNGANNLLGSAVNIAASIFNGLITFFLGFVFAIYILLQKERLGVQAKKVLYAYLPERHADAAVDIGHLTGSTFSNFLSGQCTESFILGLMFFIAMSLFRFPFALMVSVLIAFTSLIPMFGAFIGCVVGCFVILIEDPVRVIWFLLLFLILQQVEGNLIYPRVVGGSVGLPSIWVLVAVTIGGSTMGVAGMLLFIPLSSVLYALLRRNVYQKLRVNRVPPSKYR